jgi:hypothetical protein
MIPSFTIFSTTATTTALTTQGWVVHGQHQVRGDGLASDALDSVL